MYLKKETRLTWAESFCFSQFCACQRTSLHDVSLELELCDVLLGTRNQEDVTSNFSFSHPLIDMPVKALPIQQQIKI